MKYLYIAILIFIVILLFWRVVNFKKMDQSLTIRYSILVCACADIAILSYIVALMCTKEKLALAFYGMYNISCLFLVYAFLMFAQAYAKMKKIPVFIKVMFGIVGVYYAVMFIANITHECVYSLELKADGLGNTFYAVGHSTARFFAYYVILYLVIGSAVAMFIIRSVTTAKLYRKKYSTLAFVIIAAGIADCINVISKTAFDFSLLTYALIAILIYYYAFDFVPNGLLKHFIAYFVRNNEKGYIFYDMFGRCQYRNAKAEEFYRLAGNAANREQSLQGWLNGKAMQDIEEASWERTVDVEGNKRTFVTSFRQLYDDKSNYLGSFFIIDDVTEERKEYYDEWFRATHDELTGLYNREYFMEQATKAISENPNVDYCILCSDIHDFKMINDMFGVEKGNEVLLHSARVIREIVQAGDVYGRIGSDRFAICMPSEHFKKSDLETYIASIGRKSMEENFVDKVYYGVYENVGVDVPISVVCDRTIMAINKIKGNMQEHLIHYDEAYRKQVRNEQQMMNDFNVSLRERNFHLYLLPYVKENGEVGGAEALVRWLHPIHGMMMPQEFVPTFENTGLISRLDVYVWELACRQLRRWKEIGMEELYISINISARDFFFLNVYETLTNLIEQHDINPNNLHLEITEVAVVQDFKNMLVIMKKLREYGFKIYMDDFGNGYSSLNVLKDLPIDAIKIDMDFIQKSSKSEKSKKILNMIVGLSNKVGIGVIAEGVETEDQMEYINEIGCHTYQGYQFSKPVTIKSFENKYLQKQMSQ